MYLLSRPDVPCPIDISQWLFHLGMSPPLRLQLPPPVLTALIPPTLLLAVAYHPQITVARTALDVLLAMVLVRPPCVGLVPAPPKCLTHGLLLAARCWCTTGQRHSGRGPVTVHGVHDV